MSFLAKLENWFSKKEDQAEVVATEFEQYAAKKIHVLVADIAALAEKIGIPLLEEAITKGGLAAALALATGPAAAGQAFLAAAGAVVQAEAPDALHALATAAVTEAKAAVTEAAAAIAEAPKPVAAEGVNE